MKFERKRGHRCWLASIFLALAPLGLAQEAEPGEPTLQIVRLELLDSFANYPIDPESVFAPGDMVDTAFNLKDYEVSDIYRMKVRWSVETSGPTGLPFAPGAEGIFDTELAPEDDEWMPLVRFAAELPYHAPSGVYQIEVVAVDELSGVVVQQVLMVHVAGSTVEHSDVLTVQNFIFSLTEGGSELRELVYRPGATIFSSFDITGYKLGGGNSYQILSRLELLNGDGVRVYAFNLETEEGASFYPRLSVPAQLRFDLDPTIEPGVYTLALIVTDVIGTQTYSTRRSFEVR